jgi:hypothetical protein
MLHKNSLFLPCFPVLINMVFLVKLCCDGCPRSHQLNFFLSMVYQLTLLIRKFVKILGLFYQKKYLYNKQDVAAGAIPNHIHHRHLCPPHHKSLVNHKAKSISCGSDSYVCVVDIIVCFLSAIKTGCLLFRGLV